MLDSDAEVSTLSELERANLRNGKKKIIEFENFKRPDLQQKSKVNWIKVGDKNTSFYHNHLKFKNKKNMINGLMVNG